MNRNKLLNKYLLLALILTALFAMTGCRTRITNNSEVSNVYYDEDGFLSETYQMRRDELGLSTAESPIFPDLGSGETEDDFDSSEESGLNYEPEEDTYVEPPTTTTTPSTTHRYSTPGRRYSSPSGGGTTTTTTYKVTLDPGEGTINGQGGKQTQNIQKNRSFNLPGDIVKRKGYKLSGWKDGSTTHKPGAKVTVTRDVTYTAVWEKGSNKKKEEEKPTKEKPTKEKPTKEKPTKEEPTKEKPTKEKPTKEVERCTVTVDTKGGTLSGEIESSYEKGKSFNLPGADRDDGFTLKEWIVNGETKKVGSKVTVNENLTISAKWTVTPSDWDKTIKSATEKKDKTYYAKREKDIFTQCIGVHVDNPDSDYDYAVAFAENADDAKDVRQELIGDGVDESKIRIFSEPPDDMDELILYKLRLHKAIYGKDADLGIQTVEAATGLKSGDYFDEFN